MTPLEKIETLRESLALEPMTCSEGPGATCSEALGICTNCEVSAILPALLDVAEAAAKHIEERFSDAEAEPCDIGPEECSACNLDAALARLGEGE